MKACWELVEGGGDEDSALKVILVIDCFLHPGRMWDPLPPLGNDLIGLILHSTLPSPAPTPSHSDSERRADALRHFLSCLQPAPPVPYARSIQPSKMVSRLLPFQNRTVAWLLQRERHGTGSHDQGSSKDTGGFWSAYNAGPMGKVAFNRSTGQLVKLSSVEMVVNRKGKGKMQEEPDELGLVSQDRLALPNLVDLSSVKGSMLCEEMGKSMLY
jgi:E3 ubiquitin-protein ligase SHPRH